MSATFSSYGSMTSKPLLKHILSMLSLQRDKEWLNKKKIKIVINNFISSCFKFKKKVNRRELLRGSLIQKNDQLYVQRYHTEGSGVLSSIAKSDGLIELHDDMQIIKKGHYLNFYSFESLLK